jgi:hypothetical protein
MYILIAIVIALLFAIGLRIIGIGRIPSWLPGGRRGDSDQKEKVPTWLALILAAGMAIMSITQFSSYLADGDEGRIVLVLLGGAVAIGLIVTAIRSTSDRR